MTNGTTIEKPVASPEHLLNLIRAKERPLSLTDFSKQLEVFGPEKTDELRRALKKLCEEGKLLRDQYHNYHLMTDAFKVTGTLTVIRNGNGFLSVHGEDKDWFIPKKEVIKAAAMHGDSVVADIAFRDEDRTIGKIISLNGERKPLVAKVYKIDDGIIATPLDKKASINIHIPDADASSVSNGDLALIDAYDVNILNGSGKGRIRTVIGDIHSKGVERKVACHNHDIPTAFPEGLNDAAKEIVQGFSMKGRKDLTNLPFVTIDGDFKRVDDSADLDDAVYATQTQSGYRLLVAIADVSSFIPHDSELDKEARSRTRSVYFPGETYTMIPRLLSNSVCSLHEGKLRAVFVCDIKIRANGEIEDYDFYEAGIRSAKRLSYRMAQEALDNKGLTDGITLETPVMNNLRCLQRIKSAQAKAAEQRGVVEFDRKDRILSLNEAGKIQRVFFAEKYETHDMIMHAMSLANICAARFMVDNDQHGLHRIHEGLSQDEKLAIKQDMVKAGVVSTDDFIDDIAQVIEGIEDPELRQRFTLQLRGFSKPARYASRAIGHEGLKLRHYTHFTSPIRRYTDLIVHRCIKAILQRKGRTVNGAGVYSIGELDQIAEAINTTDRRAFLAVRDAEDMLIAYYYRGKENTPFNATITGTKRFGTFLKIDETQANVLFPSDLYPEFLGDSYEFVDDGLPVKGGNGLSLSVGDTVTVLLEDADPWTGKLCGVVSEE
tara:strand:- start:2369 stop:4522 length:2154 start_codon:yes stop_codon:yes gene_type:complete